MISSFKSQQCTKVAFNLVHQHSLYVMLLDFILRVILSTLTGSILWLQYFRIAVRILYYSIIALFNPTDTLGEDHGSINPFIGTFRTATLAISKAVELGPIKLVNIKTRLSFSYSLGWRGCASVTVEQFHCNIELIDYTSLSTEGKKELKKNRSHLQRSLTANILELYGKYGKYVGYLSTFNVKLNDVRIAIDDELEILIMGMSTKLSINSAEGGLVADSVLNECTLHGPREPSVHQPFPILYLSSLTAKLDAWASNSRIDTASISMGECTVGLSRDNHEVLCGALVKVVSLLSPGITRLSAAERFEVLMQKFKEIDKLSTDAMRRARELGVPLSECAFDWDQMDESDDDYWDTLEQPEIKTTSGKRTDFSFVLQRLGVLLDTNNARYVGQAMCLCDVQVISSHPPPPSCTPPRSESKEAEGVRGLDSAKDKEIVETVQTISVCVGTIKTCMADSLSLSNRGYLQMLTSTISARHTHTHSVRPSAHSSTEDNSVMSTPCLVLQYEVGKSVDGATPVSASGNVLQSSIICTIAPQYIRLSAPAVSVALSCVAECSAAVTCLGKYKMREKVATVGLCGIQNATESSVLLRSIEVSAPYLNIGLCCAEVNTAHFGSCVGADDIEGREVRENKLLNTISVTITDIVIACSLPRSLSSRDSSVRVQQYFVNVKDIVVSSSICSAEDVSDENLNEREFMRIESVSITRTVHLSHARARSLAFPGMIHAVLCEQWAASELENFSKQEDSFPSETTVQVGGIEGTLNQHDLRVCGVLAGLIGGSCRLYQPMAHYHLSPISLVHVANAAVPTKMYVIVLSVAINFRFEPDTGAIAAPTVVYTMFQDSQLSFTLYTLGTMYYKSSAYLHGDVILRRRTLHENDNGEEVEILRITQSPDSSSDDSSGAAMDRSVLPTLSVAAGGAPVSAAPNRKLCLFTTKLMPSELHCRSGALGSSNSKGSAGVGQIGVGVWACYQNIVLPQVMITLDYKQLNELCLLLRSYRLGSRLAEQVLLQHLSFPVVHADCSSISPALENAYLMQIASPTSLVAVHISNIKINMMHELEPVLSISSKKVDVHQLSFGPSVGQFILVLHSLKIFELTAKYAVHTCIFGDIDANTPNRMELIISSKAGECSLVEVQLDQMRVFYLQRSTMTMVSYLRDHIIASIYEGLNTEKPLAGCALVSTVWSPQLPAARGMMRLGIYLHKSEVHLPLNSCSTDALVIIVDNTVAYRTYPVAVATTQTNTYCKGAYLLRKQWISEIKNSRRLVTLLFTSSINKSDTSPVPAGDSTVDPSGSTLAQLFCTTPTVGAAGAAVGTTGTVHSHQHQHQHQHQSGGPLKWNLPVIARDLLTPSTGIPYNTYEDFCLEFAVNRSNICSWCDANAVAEDISLVGKYAITPISPGPDGEVRNRIWVDIDAKEVDWFLAQGQYLAIINLIQQNFCELPELVPDIYILPTPKAVALTEHLYGKYGLDDALPILSTVPIHIRRGKITAVESTPEYFNLFCRPLPPPHYPYGLGGHAIPHSTAGELSHHSEIHFKDTIPSYTKHAFHRNKIFARMSASSGGGKAEKSGGTASKRKTKSRQQAEVESGESIIGVLFERLELDFFRLHEGGGNGIDVSAGTFVIAGIDDHSTDDDDDVASVHSLSLDELSLDSIIFGPRSLPILNSGGNRNCFTASAAPRPASSPNKKSRSSSTPPKRSPVPPGEAGTIGVEPQSPLGMASADEDEASQLPPPHITYRQQGTQNLRRCVVTITDSMAVANIAKVLHAVEYFLSPVHVNTHRSLYCIAESELGPYDFKIGLDMEVHVNNTVVCLTNISRRDGASALCFHVNLDYVQAWRGFLSSGPGKIGLNIDISVMNIYIAPMREINSNCIQSLVDPCVLVVGQDMLINAPERTQQRNLDLLTPWMSLEKWAYKVIKSDLPSTTRVVKFKVAPAASTEALEAASMRGPGAASAVVGSVEERDRSKERSSSRDSGDDLQAESVSESSDSDRDADEDDERTGDAYYSGAKTSNAPTVHVHISTKDIYFIAAAVKQARTALNKRLVITTTQQDYFAESKTILQDIAHLPQLTYYLAATSLETPSRKNKNNELLAEICNFEAILRNNTYNLNILRFSVFDNCMLYTRSPEQLHMAAGSAFAMWAYNEATDLWEPLVEPINARAIGATDESMQAAGMLGDRSADGAKRSGAKVRVEVVTDPLELNAPQTALGHLIRKLSLADVVTTSSIHLPPYKVINELGVDVKFAIGMGEGIITEKEISSGKSLPVEVQQLSEALEAFKARRNYSSNMKAAGEIAAHKEYVMGITFPNFRDIYSSRTALPIDKVGVHTYDMFNTGQKIPDPSGADEVQFDRRRISMGAISSATMASIAQAAALADLTTTTAKDESTEKATSTLLARGEGEEVGDNSALLNTGESADADVDALGTAIAESDESQQQRRSGDSTSALNTIEDHAAVVSSDVNTTRSPARVPITTTAGSSSPKGLEAATGSPSRPTSLMRRNILSSTAASATDPIKFSQEVPLAVMEMRIKADGVREILLRSILSFKNNTSRVFQISVRLYGSSVETSLAPGKEWYVPVRFVNPKSSLFIRLDERANWFEALSSMQGLIVQGYWGDPSRLRAHLCACPAESLETRDTGNGWILLIKPEVKDLRAQLHGSTGKTLIPVRYPSKEAYMKAMKEGINALEVNNSGQYNSGAQSGPTMKSRGAKAQPMCIQLLAPLQLCNLIPQSLLYRLADAEGLITSEGVLLPGEMVDVHSIFKLFASRIFISVRMLNYCWSRWTLVFSRTNPFSTTERNTELTMSSMSLVHHGKELTLPTVDISMLSREYLIRFSCSVLISNRTGLLLDLCEPSSADIFIPHSSRTAAESFLPVLAHHHKHHHHTKKSGQRDGESMNTPAAGGFSERPSFRRRNRQRASSEGNVFGVYIGNADGEGEDGVDLEEGLAADEEDDGSSESESGSEENEGSLSISRSPSSVDSAVFSGSRGSFPHSLPNGEGDGYASDMMLDRQHSGSSFEATGGTTQARKDDLIAVNIDRFSTPRHTTDSPGRGKRLPRQLDNAIGTPFSPDVDGLSYGTPGAGSLVSPAVAAVPPATRANKIVHLTIHLPFDHLRQMEVVASSDWTLLDVFVRMKQRIATSSVHQSAAHYLFFTWENGKLGARKVDNSLIMEAQQQYDTANDQQQQASTKPLTGGKTTGGDAAVSAVATPVATTQPTSGKERPVSMFSRERSISTTGGARKQSLDTEPPAPMQFEMLADCNSTPLTMATRVESLPGLRLRLCHVMEWEIFKQTKSIKTEVVEKEGLFSSMFGRPKCTHLATMVPFEGDIPFKPHRMMGFSPSLSMRVPSAGTDWSDSVDILKGDFDVSELSIVATSTPTPVQSTSNTSSRASTRLAQPPAPPSAVTPSTALSSSAPPVYYEFGAYLERGRGFLQNVTTVTLVPKHVLVSKLSFAIQIRQIFPSAECEPLTLLPGTLCSYHFPCQSKSKLLQIRKVAVPSMSNDGKQREDTFKVSADTPVTVVGEWLAELDICKIGVLYAKIRDPIQIIKVQIDTVGASMVATLTEQSILWPPYRIDNMTEMEVRFRQVSQLSPGAAAVVGTNATAAKRANSSSALAGKGLDPIQEVPSETTSSGSGRSKEQEREAAQVASSSVSAASTAVTAASASAVVSGLVAKGEQELPWDHLEKANSAPFAWDRPFTGKKAIQLEVRQLASSWVPAEIYLDDDDKPAPILVKKAAPSLGNPCAEGYLLRQDVGGDTWSQVYCIMRPDVLYVYPDDSRDYLIEVINLSVLRSGDVAPQFANVSRYTDKRWPGTMGYISAVMGSAAKSKAVDINKTRCMLLKIAEFLGLFTSVMEHSFAKTRDREDSSEGASEAGSPTKGLLEDAPVTPRSPGGALKVTFGDDVDQDMDQDECKATKRGIAESVAEGVAEGVADSVGRERLSSGNDIDWGDLLEDRETFSEFPEGGVNPPSTEIAREQPPFQHTAVVAEDRDGESPFGAADGSEAASSRESVASSRRARFNSGMGGSLASLFAAKISVEELLEEAASVPIRTSEVIEALLVTKQVDRVERAREICEWMLTEGLLMPKATSRHIDDSDLNDLILSEDEYTAQMASTTTGAVGEISSTSPPENNNNTNESSNTEVAGNNSDEDPDEMADTFPSDGNVGSKGGVAQASRRSVSSAPLSRASFSKQLSRALSSRHPTAGGASDDAVYHEANNRKSIVSLTRRKPTLLRLYENTDLFLCPPPLNPEMQAMLDQINAEDDFGVPNQASSAGAASSGGATEPEVFGFTITMEGVKHCFRCSSEMEFFGWIQACRQSIELLWVEHLLGHRADKKAVSLDDYQATILLRLRADGSTKVLEVMQDDENITKEARSKSNRRLRGSRKSTVSSAEAIGKLSRVIRNSHLAPSLLADVDYAKEFNREKELISVFFSVHSVALSVINSEPSELLYLSLTGIEMTVERSIDLVKFSGTVQEIQLSNQLLDPEFPVILFPRRIREGQSGRLMLPGLNQDRATFPSLHLYIQQRYHQSISDVGNPAAADSFEEDSNLHYFEMFTVWISPMKLDLEEEIIVKCIRYVRGLKDVVYNPMLGRGAELTEDILSLQQLGSKSWEGHADRRAVFDLYMRLLEAGKMPYQTYSPSAKSSTGIYLSLLQLHPIDLVMSFRPSPNIQVTNSEIAMISIISQLDSARLCLNALIAEHAFGSPAILGEVLVKHYKAAFWRQFHRLIGSTDIVEGSVGLVANLGSGVYDLFYEPIDGLLDENGSFLTGLSKGGISLASRTIGGTSAFTSQITGGLGKGVSLLTLDSQFQRNRAYRRFNKTSTVSQGLYVGTQELGKNIMEGVTGIVVSPYRGWETGGGVGFGMGIAKGILGVALKPAVGVFDLASRATEGLRNTAFSDNQSMLEERFGIHRKRIPRAFGRNGQIALYDAKAAAAQYLADCVTFFQPEPRMQVVYHLYIRRKLEKYRIPGIDAQPTEHELEGSPNESWGFPINHSYVVLVGHNRVVLAEVRSPEKSNPTGKKVSKRNTSKPRKFIWSCPANCIDQLYSDPNGDLILSIGNSALISGSWNNSSPVVLDNYAQNYVIFQSLLEQTIGYKRARNQPLTPVDGLFQSDIRKRYSSGIKSYLLSPSNHSYRLCGSVLYEYSITAAKKATSKSDASTGTGGTGEVGGEGAAGAQQQPLDSPDAVDPTRAELFIDQLINRIFPTEIATPTAASSSSAAASGGGGAGKGTNIDEDMYMSFIYPLSDMYVSDPSPEDGGKYHSITMARLDGQKMRVLRRDEEQEHYAEYLKNSLSLIFSKQEDALTWKRELEEHMLWNLEEDELVPAGTLTTEERRKQGRTIMAMARGTEEILQPPDNSILGVLVLPTSAIKPEQAENIKIEIAKTLSSTRWT